LGTPARLIQAFLAGRSPATVLAYRRDLEDFRRFLGAQDLNAAAAALLTGGPAAGNQLALGYRAHMLDRGLSPATINRRLAALRSLARLARLLGLTNWSLEVRNVSAEAYRDTSGPGAAGFRAILAAVAGDDPKARRDRAILRLLYDLALRRGEVVGLDVEHVDLQAGTLAVLGKGRLQRRLLGLPRLTREALAAWLAVHPSGKGPLFVPLDRAGRARARRRGDPSRERSRGPQSRNVAIGVPRLGTPTGSGRLTGSAVWYLVRRYCRLAGVPPTRPHGLRHAAITEAVKAAQQAGIGLEEVLDFSRHAKVTTLMIYRDRERNVQGRLAEMVASSAEVP